MTTAIPQTTSRSSTAKILFTLAQHRLGSEVAPPSKYTARAAYIETQLAQLGTQISSRPDLDELKRNIEFDIVLTESRSLTEPSRQLIAASRNQLKTLQPELGALDQAYEKLETDYRTLEETIKTRLKTVCDKILSAKNPQEMLFSQDVQSGLKTLEEQLQRLKNNTVSLRRTGDTVKEKLEMTQTSVKALEIGTKPSTERTFEAKGERPVI